MAKLYQNNFITLAAWVASCEINLCRSSKTFNVKIVITNPFTNFLHLLYLFYGINYNCKKFNNTVPRTEKLNNLRQNIFLWKKCLNGVKWLKRILNIFFVHRQRPIRSNQRRIINYTKGRHDIRSDDNMSDDTQHCGTRHYHSHLNDTHHNDTHRNGS